MEKAIIRGAGATQPVTITVINHGPDEVQVRLPAGPITVAPYGYQMLSPSRSKRACVSMVGILASSDAQGWAMVV